jgi:hypothetical protein
MVTATALAGGRSCIVYPRRSALFNSREVWVGTSWSSYQHCIEGAQLAFTWLSKACSGSVQVSAVANVDVRCKYCLILAAVPAG